MPPQISRRRPRAEPGHIDPSAVKGAGEGAKEGLTMFWDKKRRRA